MIDGTRPPARLLIADDHPLLRQAIRTTFSSEPDIEVIEEAENGLEVIELCRSLHPDLVLMDLSMPVMDGIEATKKIKEECPKTSILILTAHEDPGYLFEAVRAGAAGYALKICTSEVLLEAVRRVLEGGSSLDEGLSMSVLRGLANEMPEGKRRKGYSHEEDLSVHASEKHPEPPPPGGSAGSLRATLTPREIEILRLVAKGYTNRKISEELCVARNTARNHVQHVIAKLGVSDRTQAAVRAIELGLLSTTNEQEEEERC